MNHVMLLRFDNLLIYAGGTVTSFGYILITLAVGCVVLVGICGDTLNNWIKRTRGRDWPTVSAVVDVVSVAFMKDDSPIPRLNTNTNLPYYLATLTYIYQYPEQQMGDYNRRFSDKDEAEAWANSYKGETVKVHVDPRDPTRSVLHEEDL